MKYGYRVWVRNIHASFDLQRYHRIRCLRPSNQTFEYSNIRHFRTMNMALESHRMDTSSPFPHSQVLINKNREP